MVLKVQAILFNLVIWKCVSPILMLVSIEIFPFNSPSIESIDERGSTSLLTL